MSNAPNEDGPFEALRIESPLLRAMDDFDTNRNAFYDEVSETAAQGYGISPEQTDGWQRQIDGISRHFAAVGEAICQGGDDIKNQTRLLAELLVSDDSDRVSLFQELVSDGDPGAEEVFTPLNSRSAKRRVKESFYMSEGSPVAFGEGLAGHYRAIAAPDLKQLMDIMSSRQKSAVDPRQDADSDTSIDIYIDTDALKKIASTAAKLSVGALIGLMWARRHRSGRDN